MVLDNHIIHQIEAMLNPINVDEAHLQVDLIKQVGVGGEFLTKKATMQYTRQEYIPMWPPHGADLMELVHAEAQEILENHTPPPLPAGAEERVQEILEEADKALMM
jgi:trimethylamine--corrinoid protein Co-methyltransferase